MKKHHTPTAPAGKLAFSVETVRRLADTLSDDQLEHVEGGLFRQSQCRTRPTAEC